MIILALLLCALSGLAQQAPESSNASLNFSLVTKVMTQHGSVHAEPVGDASDWQPSAAPEGLQRTLDVRAKIFDVSGTMTNGQTDLSRQARTVATYAVNDVDHGTYVILAVFGTFGGVVADRYVLTEYDRTVLAEEIRSHVDKPGFDGISEKTDIRGLESMIIQIRDGLKTAFAGRGFRLQVTIFTDGRPDSVDPADRDRTFDVLLGRRTDRIPLAEHLYAYRLNIEHNPAPVSDSTSEMIDSFGIDTKIADFDTTTTAAAFPDTKVAEETDEGSHSATDALWILAALGFGVIVSGSVIAVRVIRKSREEARTILQASAARAGDEPQEGDRRLILASEFDVDENGEPVPIQDPRTLAYSPNVPLSIGGDIRSTFVLKSAAAPRHLATVEVDRHGRARISSRCKNLRLDGDDVTGSTTTDLNEPHVLSARGLLLRLQLTTDESEGEETFFRPDRGADRHDGRRGAEADREPVYGGDQDRDGARTITSDNE